MENTKIKHFPVELDCGPMIEHFRTENVSYNTWRDEFIVQKNGAVSISGVFKKGDNITINKYQQEKPMDFYTRAKTAFLILTGKL